MLTNFNEKVGDFSLDFFRQANEASPAQNAVFSPVSVLLALALVQRASAGNTRRQLSKRLFGAEDPGADAQIVRDLTSLQQLLTSRKGSKNATLAIASRLFVDKALPLESNYLAESRSIFGAEPQSTEFGRNIEQAKQTINTWVRDQTKEKIPELLKTLDPTTRLVIANAIYFKANWQNKFDPSKTRRESFKADAQSPEVQLDFMNQMANAAMARDDKMHILVMPYTAQNLSMVFVLPKQPFGLAAVEQSLTTRKLFDLIGKADRFTRTDIKIPKFKLEKAFDLKIILSRLGLAELFTSQADLSNLSKMPLFVNDGVHKAFLEVNEEGAEGAGGTAVATGFRSGPPRFYADQPFMFAIADTQAKTLLFLGHFYGK